MFLYLSESWLHSWVLVCCLCEIGCQTCLSLNQGWTLFWCHHLVDGLWTWKCSENLGLCSGSRRHRRLHLFWCHNGFCGELGPSLGFDCFSMALETSWRRFGCFVNWYIEYFDFCEGRFSKCKIAFKTWCFADSTSGAVALRHRVRTTLAISASMKLLNWHSSSTNYRTISVDYI